MTQPSKKEELKAELDVINARYVKIQEELKKIEFFERITKVKECIGKAYELTDKSNNLVTKYIYVHNYTSKGYASNICVIQTKGARDTYAITEEDSFNPFFLEDIGEKIKEIPYPKFKKHRDTAIKYVVALTRKSDDN